MVRKKWMFLFALLVSLFLIAACGSEEVTTEKSDEPVVIKVAQPWDEAIFNTRFGLIDEKLENVIIEYVPFHGTSEFLEEMFADDIRPDIFITSARLLQDYDLIHPLDDLIDKHNFDLSSINPSLVAFMRSLDSDQRMIGFPDGTSYRGLYYNKEVFDLFGVPYPDPEVPMTWEEVLDLAKRLTGTRNDIDYVGLEIQNKMDPLRQFAVTATDPDTGEVLVTKRPEFKRYFEFMNEYYNIPGISEETVAGAFPQKRAAMIVAWHRYFWGGVWEDLEYQQNMDVAPIPIWGDKPFHPYLDTTPMMIAKYSEHKDEAFQVLMEYVSKENQMIISKEMGSGIVVTDEEVRAQFGSEVPNYMNVNVDAFFVKDPAIIEGRQSQKWDGYVDIGSALRKLDVEKKDVNTVLRELEEESQAKIKDAQEQE